MKIKEFLNKFRDKNVLIIGLGNRLRGDDAAGLLLAEKVNNLKYKVICAESGIENYIGKIIEAKADIIIIIDAVFLNEKIGSYKIFSSDFVQNNEIISHSLSFNILKDLIKSKIHSKIFFIGIQPKTIAIGDKPTLPVIKTINLLAKAINSINY